jgi:trehalose synthase
VSNARTSDLWWKTAVIYCLDVETFFDWDGDGIGDLTGLTERIDYLAGLGISCIWLMPFQPSPNRDDGYDITDYYGVDPRLGSLGDFVALVRTAKDRGLRVIIDLVVNHTSDRHPWFRAARSSPASEFRDFYVWADQPRDEPKAEVVFPDAEDGIWAYDDKAGQYYLHHFYSHQPDLNIGNPRVREEIAKVIGFWLELGVDGFRMDAVPFLLETGGIVGDTDLDPHDFLRDLRSFVARRRGDALLLGEVNLPADDLPAYFGGADGDEIQLLFNFPLMQATYLAFARQDASPLAAALTTTVRQTDDQQYANFLRNHDELTLDKLTDDERGEVFAAFGPDADMQLFGRGLRRRLPSMFGGDPKRIRMAYSLMFSLPGTPVLFYGEEIGMAENLVIDGRASVRSPMQWSDDRNGGFSTARAARLRRPVVEGQFGPLAVNVAAQRRDSDSLLNWMERLIRRRRETPEIAWGDWQVLSTDVAAVFAHRCEWDGGVVVAVHNLAAEPCKVRVDLAAGDEGSRLDDLLDEEPASAALDRRAVELTLEGYGYRWFRLMRPERPAPP